MPRLNYGFFGDDGDYSSKRECPAYANHNKKSTLPYIHYSNPYWNTGRTIWGAEEKGLHYEYSDRLEQWDYDKAKKSREEASKQIKDFTPEWIELYLTLYHGKQVELRHIIGGVNVSNGYNYYCYGFRFKEEQKDASKESA